MIGVDASVAAKWFLQEEWTDHARALLSATLEANQAIVAPPLLPIEITNVLRRRLRASEPLSLARAVAFLDDFLRLPIVIQNPPDLHRHALVLADTYGLPAAYDAHYLALAEQLDCELWTDDRRLLRVVGHRLPFVPPISEYAGSHES